MAIKTPKIVLYHIPKCGGVWAKEALRRSMTNPSEDYGRCVRQTFINEFGLYREHAPPDGVVEEDKRGRLSICFVRHPIAWYRSFWAFRIKTESYGKNFPLDPLVVDGSYENFINNVLDEYPDGFLWRMYQVFTGEDLSKINFIGKQEQLADDLVEALTLSGQEFNEKRLRNMKMTNVAGSHKKYLPLTELKSATIERIIKAEEWVVNTFYKDV